MRFRQSQKALSSLILTTVIVGCADKLQTNQHPQPDPHGMLLTLGGEYRDKHDQLQSTIGLEHYVIHSSHLKTIAFTPGRPPTGFNFYHGALLQLIAEHEGIFIEWSPILPRPLRNISVRPGWMGMTDTELYLGVSLGHFLDTYPRATQRYLHPDYRHQQVGEFWTNGHMKANFVNNILRMIEISDTNHDLSDPREYVNPIGPYEWHDH